MSAVASRARLPLGLAREGVHFTLGPRLARAASVRAYERRAGEPTSRPLRIYALDPAASMRDGAVAVVNVPYERIEPGPIGALVEVVAERDTADAAPFDLDDQIVLLGQGCAASATDPRFRRQMLYAVCTTTYAAFRHALGRDLAWGFDRAPAPGEPLRLRIVPNVEGMQNAYYDRCRGELRFGSYRAPPDVQGRTPPDGTVFTALSHDIVVHETSHALLDGMRRHFMLPTNPDVLAFHEAFADLVALLQRFTYRDVVRAGVRGARGDLLRAELLTDIARQFGQSVGMTGSLRSAVGGTDLRYGDATEPHELGKVLVAAVFKAFGAVYALKASRLVRLATGGTGILPDGEIPDLLVDLLTDTACNLASQFLSVCIRAIDYCPPVDITFGEYLRAVISADRDLVPDDTWGYREAWIDAFRAYRIYPSNVPSLTEDALVWQPPDVPVPDEPDLGFGRLQFGGEPGRPASAEELLRQGRALGGLVCDPAYAECFGLLAADDPRLAGDRVDLPVIHSIRTARRIGPDGQVLFDLVAEVTQRREVAPRDGRPGFDFQGGSTILLDPLGGVRYVVRKAVFQDARLERQRAFIQSDASFWGDGPFGRRYPEPAPLRLLHGAGHM